jgi:hypothetical protein
MMPDAPKMRWITTPLPLGTAGSPTPIDLAAISVFFWRMRP